jgi:CMD domain protein
MMNDDKLTSDRDVVAAAAGIVPGSHLAEALAGRADLMALTQRSHDAALTPRDPGGLSHAERAALACRMTRLNREAHLTRHYESLMHAADADEDTARIADPAFKGGSDSRLRAMLWHTDLVTREPRNATGADIDALRAAGLADADIVRLSGLIAFVSYQLRLVFGLRLMGERS